MARLSGVQLASADPEPYEGTFFDPRPMTRLPRHGAPTPPERPYAAGGGEESCTGR